MQGMKIKEGIYSYVAMDYFTALLSWASFFTLRKIIIEHYTLSQFSIFLNDRRFVQGIIAIPLGWLLLYYLTGTYTNIYLKSRVSEITRTFFVTVMGVIILFFTVLIDDRVVNYRDYYESVAILLTVHFLLTVTGRFLVLNRGKYQMEKGNIYFPTLFIGGNKRAIEVHHELNGKSKSQGYQFIGFIDTNGNGSSNGNGLSTYLPKLG